MFNVGAWRGVWLGWESDSGMDGCGLCMTHTSVANRGSRPGFRGPRAPAAAPRAMPTAGMTAFCQIMSSTKGRITVTANCRRLLVQNHWTAAKPSFAGRQTRKLTLLLRLRGAGKQG